MELEKCTQQRLKRHQSIAKAIKMAQIWICVLTFDTDTNYGITPYK